MNVRAGRLAAALAIVPLSFALGGFAARFALRAAPPLAGEGLAQALPVVTAWQGYGAALWTILAISIACATIGAALALRFIAETPHSSRATVLGIVLCAAATLAAALTWPIVFSSDVYAYAAYGEESLRGINPYAALAPNPRDGVFSAAAWQWGGTFPACVYGSAFVGLARLIVAATHAFGLAAMLLAFRIVACAAFLAAALALLGAWHRQGRILAFAAFALNPMALWSAAEGHNDALMLAVALAGALVATSRRPLAGGVLIGLSALIKAPGIAAATALSAFALAAQPARVRALVIGLVVALAVAVVLELPHALTLASQFSGRAHYAPQASAQALVLIALRAAGLTASAPVVAVAAVAAVCAALAAYGFALFRAHEPGGLALLAIAGWLAIPNPYPWYGLWVLPLAALWLMRPAFSALWIATIAIVVRYLPDAYGVLSSDQQAVIAVVALLPLLLALRGARDLEGARKPALR